MKHFLLIFIAIVFGVLTHAQTQYEVSNDGNDKILKGIISKDLIVKDPSFKWFSENQAGYHPASTSVTALKENTSKIEFVVFGGTWSGDTKYILPKFLSMLDAASFPIDKLTLIGVDRNKKSTDNLTETMHIVSIPTIIVLKDGKEIGRVVEYGKTGNWEKEIEHLISTVNQPIY